MQNLTPILLYNRRNSFHKIVHPQASEGDVKFENVKIGGVYEVKVKNVKQLQLNVQFGRKVGTTKIIFTG